VYYWLGVEIHHGKGQFGGGLLSIGQYWIFSQLVVQPHPTCDISHDLFTKMKGTCICVNFLNPDLLFDSFRDVAMAADFGQNLRPLFNTLTFRNGFEYCNSELEVIMGTLCATFYAILVKIGPLTPKISQGVSVPFGKKRQKSIYHTKYLSKYWTELHQLFSVGRRVYADYKTEIHFAVIEEMLLW